ncbi:MAG: LON peptidase substrate-binding domain-containing protein, partial [Thermoanaerobaculia bacterium]
MVLPLFPLPSVVLFPNVFLPLHIFEPRYRQMLADSLAGDSCFGMVYHPEGAADGQIPRGQIGCVAHVEKTETLPDGRSNIVVLGGDRFRFEELVERDKPYYVGEASDY